MNSIDALLDRPSLPSPSARAALRRAGGITQAEAAQALGVTTAAFRAWEAGTANPRARHRAVYLELLDGLAKKYPDVVKAVMPDSP